MQIVMNVGLVAIVSLGASFLLMAKLHEQLSGLIQGRIYRDRSGKMPVGVRAKYRASPKELMLHIVFFGLLGIAVGLLVYLEQQLLPLLVVSALALVVFYLFAKEVMKNFTLEEGRNRSVFEKRKRR